MYTKNLVWGLVLGGVAFVAYAWSKHTVHFDVSQISFSAVFVIIVFSSLRRQNKQLALSAFMIGLSAAAVVGSLAVMIARNIAR
jgi:hypothetical protein